MIRKLLIMSVLLIGGGKLLYSQSVDFIKSDTENYIYGEGFAVTQSAADEAALANLINQISVSVKSEFISEEREKITNGGSSMSETNYKSIIQTYSNATLNNTERIIIKQEPDAHVFRYIKKSEIDKIFQARQEKAIEYVRLGDDALNDGQIDDALKYYYWSLCLARSLRYPGNAKIFADGKEQTIVTLIPDKINDICSDISIKLFPGTDGIYRLNALYKNRPIRSMDYTYNDGGGYSDAIYSVRDGEGVIELLPTSSPSKITVKIEYVFAGLAMVDSEVETLLPLQQDIFRRAYIDVLLPAKGNNASAVSIAAQSSNNVTSSLVTASAHNNANYGEEMNKCLATVNKIGEAMRKSQIGEVQSFFTDDAYHSFSTILGYGRYTVGDSCRLECVYNESDSTFVCRGLPCLFRFSNRRTFNELLSFTFRDGKISHVALGLGRQMAEEEIACHGDWGLEARKRIVSFLEDYRTAYATKDVDFMDRVFDDNAVIIVGKKLKRDPRYNDGKLLNNEYVKLTRHTKEQFIKNLKASFAGKEYINLHFSNCEVIQLRSGVDRYGIQLKQEYYSSNYGDTGYLYLLLDLTNPKEPIIHVRTWQPQPDPDFGVIGAGHF